jgi:putative ABC transport system permease protein
VISAAMAKQYWPDTDPIGQRLLIELGENPLEREIVGVVGDVRTEPNAPAAPMMYVPYRQIPVRTMTIAAETRLPLAEAGRAIAHAVRQIDGDQPIFNIRTMDMVVSERLAPWRFSMTLVSGFAFLALALAVVGVFAVLAQTVLERTNELGIRLALGATSSQLVRVVVARGMGVATAGAALGLAATLLTARWISSQVYGVSSTDAAALAVAVAVLLGASAAACFIPARRAARVDPLTAMRAD